MSQSAHERKTSVIFQLTPGIQEGIAIGVEALMSDPRPEEVHPNTLQDPIKNDLVDELRRRIANTFSPEPSGG
jgi:hypothetical protein